jgi:NAD(P)-dependent dehydrogenase (short-subunit alcohol dehydrogenase family)
VPTSPWGVRDPGTATPVVADIHALGRRAHRVALDLTDLPSVRRAVQQVETELGPIDVLVNNVGLSHPEPAELVSEESFDRVVQANLRGTFFTTQEVGRRMCARGAGRIIMMGSQAGEVALPGESVYCMTKAAIAHLARCLAVEWGGHGVTVNTVAPTFVETDGTADMLSDPAFRRDVLDRIAGTHRIGTPADVTGAVVFLAAPASAQVTGHTLLVDGGWTAR